MLSRRSRARWGAACVLACLSLTPQAFLGTAAQAAAQTDLPSPSQPPSFIQAQQQDGRFKSDGFMSPSYWPIGLWNTPDSAASVHPSPAPSPSPVAPGSSSKTQGASAPAQQYEGSAAASRRLQAPDSAPPTSSLRPAHLESQSVPARAYSFVASPAVAPPTPARSSPSQTSFGGPSLITFTNADTAPAVAGPAGAPTVPSYQVGPTPSPTGSRDSTVTIRPGVPRTAPAPAPASPTGRNASQQPAPSPAQAPSPAAVAPAPGAMAPGPSARAQNATAAAAPPTVSAYSVGNVSPSRNPFEPGSRVPSTPVSTPSSGTNSQPAMAGLGIPTLSPNVAGFGVQTPGSSPSPAGSSPTDNSSGSAVASGGGAQPPLNTLAGQFPNASAAAPAPTAASNPYNTLTPDTQLGSLSTMVVELLLTGQQLFPFSAADQYYVASSMNGLLNSYPHLQELSNIGIVAVITPQDSSGNGTTNGSNAQPDLALIGIPVSSPYPMPPAARAPAPGPPGLSAALANAVQGNSSNSSTAPAPAPAAAAAANSSSGRAVASRVPPATTPAPAASNPLGGSLAPATSGRRRLLAGSPTVSYDVGGAQHVAVNLTIRAQDSLIVPIQRTLNESIRGGSFLQTVNNSGLILEKVEIVLMQQISGPTAPTPAPAPAAPAPLVDRLIGLPVQTAVPPSLGPTAAPIQQSAAGAGSSTSNRNTIIIAVVCVVGAAVVFAVIGAAAILWHRARRNRKVAKSSVRKHDSEEADIDKVERNGFHSGGWAEGDRGGGPGAGKQRGPAGVVAIRTDGEQGASYAGISPDSVGAGHDLANGLASPARRHPSGISDWGTGSDGTNLNSRDQLLSHNKRRSSNAGNGSPHGPGRMQQDGRPQGLHMYDSAAESSQPAQRSNSNGPLGRNGSGPGMHDFARQGTLAGEASLPSDVETPHSRNGSTPSSIGRLQRIGAAQLWQVSFEQMQIQKQIGEGSFGKVYLAKWKETTVAVKILTNPNGSSDDDFPTRLPNPLLQSLEKEAGMMAAMRHPNVVLYLGVCLDPPCVVTEYCARGSLNDVLKRALYNPKYAEQLDWRVRLSMALDAAKGMNYLHTSDPPVIHRDLKSPNLLVDKHWRVKVCDFNLSRVMEESAVLSSMAATNPRWLAPEILAGRGYTFSSDVYSFGIILWEFLTWRVPWHEFGPWQVVAMVTDGHQRPEIPRESLCPSASFPGMGEYVKLMQSCWEQEARKRPTFAEIIQVLRKLFGEEARRNPATGPGEMMPERSVLQASTSGGSGEMSQKAQQALLGSSGELQNGHRQGGGLAGEQLPGLAGLRFHMSNDRRSGSGQHLMPGSPNPGERSDVAVLSGQHGRSESIGSENHLQAYVTRHASVAAQQSESARVADSPRTSDHVFREGSGLPPLARRDGQDGSGQLSSNGDWPQDPRDRIAAAHAVSDTSSQHDNTFSPPDSRTHSMREYTHSLPPVGEGHERESGAHDSAQHADEDVRRPAA